MLAMISRGQYDAAYDIGQFLYTGVEYPILLKFSLLLLLLFFFGVGIWRGCCIIE